MRLIGVAEVALEKMCKRTKERVAFGKPVAEQTVTQERIAESRIMIDQCRLLTLHAAHKMVVHGNKEARKEIGQEIEGLNTVSEVSVLAKKNHVEMPISEQVNSVVNCECTAHFIIK